MPPFTFWPCGKTSFEGVGGGEGWGWVARRRLSVSIQRPICGYNYHSVSCYARFVVAFPSDSGRHLILYYDLQYLLQMFFQHIRDPVAHSFATAKHHVFVKKGCWNADLPLVMPLKQCYRAIANNRSSRFLWCSIIIYTLCFRLQISSWRLTCLTLSVSKARVPDFDTTSCPIW